VANLEKESQDACAAALRKHGFVAKRRGLLLQPCPNKTVTGVLGLNLATWTPPESVQVNPVVGVRHVPLEKAMKALDGQETPWSAVRQPLGYLMPENMLRQWEFKRSQDPSPIAEELADTVARYGQPFIEKWSDWRTYAREIADSGLLPKTELPIVLPVIAALDGDRERADRIIRDELDRIGEAADVYSAGYREFATRFADFG
jgi:hypothetical protein